MTPDTTVRVDGRRLIERLRDLARIGARPDGGIDRQAFSAADAAGRELIAHWGADAGLSVLTDTIGNLYLRHAPPGCDESAAAVLSGSHADTQPAGGWLDGAYGVVAALEAVQSIRDAAPTLERPVEAVVWVNEEGSRFQPGLMGSAHFAGHFDPAAASIRGVDGTELGTAVAAYKAATSWVPERSTPFAVAGVVEAHIEQGPILERVAIPIGVVEAVQGIRWYRVDVVGEAAHAGTTPRSNRRDAVLAATRAIHDLAAAMRDPDDELRFTVGTIAVSPGSPNTVADKVTFAIDLRHRDDDVLEASEQTIERICRDVTAPCTATVTRTEHQPPVRFDPAVIATIDAAADRLGLARQRIVSGAGHDTAALAGSFPAGMIFVPCHGGVSHHPAEDADEGDLVAGADVLATTLAALAGPRRAGWVSDT